MNFMMLQDPIAKILGSWSSDISVGSIILRVSLAVIFGGLIGAERAMRHHVAGLRTYILVCLGACVAMCVNQFLADASDTARLGAGVITGIGFLGAGTIMVTTRNQIKGLTTAAALWAIGAIGLSIGIGFYTLSVIAEVAMILAIIVLPMFEHILQKGSSTYSVHVELTQRPDLRTLIDYLRSINIEIVSISYDPAYAQSGLSVYTLRVNSKKNTENKYYKHNELVLLLNNLDYVHFAEFII